MSSKHFYASARIHQSTPRVAFCFASRKERDAFIERFNKTSKHPVLRAGAVSADYVYKWRRYRTGIHFLYVVSGNAPRWGNMHKYTPDFYAIGCGSWPKGWPYPTYPYASTANQS